MKKFIKSAISFTAIIVLCLSIAGCSLFKAPDKGSIDNIDDSKVLASTLNFATQNVSERKLLTGAEACALVERSVVALEIVYQGGTSYGSGVIIQDEDADANSKIFYIITCHHVISSLGTINVYVPDENGRNFTDGDYNSEYKFTGVIDNKIHTDKAVTLVGGDKDGDIAVLKLNTTGKNVNIVSANVPVEGYSVKKGEEVFAVGNPTGQLPGTYQDGVIGYIEREATISSVGIMSLYQINVDITHGNSGGGLFNMYGELIGITNAGSDENEGLNYSIPFEGTDSFVTVAKQLIATATDSNYGYVSGRWSLGITIADKTNFGLVVNSVETGSDDDKAGVLANDVIVGIKYTDKNNQPVSKEVSSSSSFTLVYYEIKEFLTSGDKISLIVNRGSPINQTLELTLTQNIFCDTGFYPTAE